MFCLASAKIDNIMISTKYIAIKNEVIYRNLKILSKLRISTKKNSPTIHIVVTAQHKHKIKHDKTTMQSYLLKTNLMYLHHYSHNDVSDSQICASL